ncbi:hypothetical protein H1W00_00790 [Aeromicrobium sp. Marseille-Q0843]|uniref:Ig-like domain (Group 3) n=1 Tax=Aeromicrobium phoceense TaxID=2754045 RepID=A0A838XDL7_9ACTN|nr:hypothetical protein [Aeromicrobium phoceense]MBA4607011.1 hypothetical protein [Aeromicrobium phoceense]
MNTMVRRVLIALLALTASLLIAPAGTASALPTEAADPVTISGRITAEDFDFEAYAESEPYLRVGVLARVDGKWTQVGGTGSAPFVDPELRINPDGSYRVQVPAPHTQVRLTFGQVRCADDSLGMCDLSVRPDKPAADVQSVFWDGTTHGALDVNAAADISVASGSVTDRNITLKRSKKVRATARPRIVGDPSPGQVLTAFPGTYAPAAESLALRWYWSSDVYDLYDVPDGTGRAYRRLTSADLGLRIAVTAEPSVRGWESPVFHSQFVTVKSRSKFAVKAKAGKRKATVTIAIKAPGVTKSRIHGKASIYAKGKRIKTVNVKNGKATIKIAKQKKGKRTYTVRYSGNRVITSSSKSLKIAIR